MMYVQNVYTTNDVAREVENHEAQGGRVVAVLPESFKLSERTSGLFVVHSWAMIVKSDPVTPLILKEGENWADGQTNQR